MSRLLFQCAETALKRFSLPVTHLVVED